MPDCPVDQGECLAWVHKYLMDCVCDFHDEMSLVLGLTSVFSWGVAEVPQIITNFKEQNTEGVSLAFLMTWVVGDVFNLAGCYLEPATLPTQFYMALLYTLTTLVLVGQTIYFGHLRSYFHPPEPIKDGSDSAAKEEEDVQKQAKLDVEAQKHPRPDKRVDRSSPELSSTINVPHHGHRRAGSRELYYTSARSLASSHTPIVGSYLVGSRESGSATQSFLRPASTQAAAASQDCPIPSNCSPSHGDSPVSSNSAGAGSLLGRSTTAAAASVLILGTVGLSSNYISGGSFGFSQRPSGRILRRAGRSLLFKQGSSSGASRIPHYFREAEPNGPLGEVLGWLMAAIYMGGRLPQIVLNFKRGTVEGLNPLMFIFALVGNVTYVSSILVRTLDWTQIKPNLPWLVDAGVCVGLDCFIIGQFFYYEYLGGKVTGDGSEKEEDNNGSYELVR